MLNINYFIKSSEAIKDIYREENSLDQALKLISKTLKNNKKILVAGNGGSNSDAEHFVGELVCTFNKKNRRGLSAIHLGGNSTSLTAWGNDFDFHTYIQREVQSLGKSGDLLFLISTGGGDLKKKTSYNMILANKMAKTLNLKTISLVGKSGGYLSKNSDVVIHVKNDITSIIQECHITILHYLCYGIDELFD